MIRFNKTNLLKLFLVAVICIIGLDLITKSENDLNSGEIFPTGKSEYKFVRFQTKQVPKPDSRLGKINKNIDSNSNQNQINSVHMNEYITDISVSARRMNSLFAILLEKEKRYKSAMENLGLVLFENMINGKQDSALEKFPDETKKFLKIEDNRVNVTDEFISFLHNISDFYTFKQSKQREIKKMRVTSKTDKPVIVTAANSNYYMPLQATLYQLHNFMPSHEIIVYDLGLTAEQYKMTVDNCRCQVIKFDPSYSKVSAHIGDLKTYAWKPILIQETFKTHESIIYIDSSIRISTDEIGSQLERLKETSLLTQFIGLKLNCYTNPLMFKWFGESADSYVEMFTIEANILLFRRSFVSSLIMKAWVTCALDKDCIEPPGSRIGGCCGCHRYDQDAITIVASYFFGHPKDVRSKLPAYSLTSLESYFFSVRRYEGRSYFTAKP